MVDAEFQVATKARNAGEIGDPSRRGARVARPARNRAPPGLRGVGGARISCTREDRKDMARWLIILGVVLVLAGLLWPLLSRIGLGRLPGDIMIEREHFRLYVPITTSILISLVLSLILWLLNR
jgi:Protein of unknown function (DUF2905)